MIPICECGYKFKQEDIGVINCGPDNYTTFVCPDCHCITEFGTDEVEL